MAGKSGVALPKQFDSMYDCLDVQMAEMDLRFQILETASYDGTLLWKKRNYTRRKQEAISGKTLTLYSQPFYTHKYGYRMCARINLNGMGKGTHMRGEVSMIIFLSGHLKTALIRYRQLTRRG